MEHIAGIDYVQIAKFLESTKQQASSSILLNKPEFTQLLSVAQTEREHHCISYCIYLYMSLGLSFKSARRHFGFNRMAQRIARMDKCINEIQTIHECADRFIVIKEASRLRSLGCTGDGGHGGVIMSWILALEIVTTQLMDNTMKVMESWMPRF